MAWCEFWKNSPTWYDNLAPLTGGHSNARLGTLSYAGLGQLLLIAVVGSLVMRGRANALTRNIFDCGDPNGDANCVMDFLDDGHFYGRSEGEPPRGPNPSHLVFANGKDVFGSTDVDTLYDLLGPLHSYYTTKLNRNGPNSLGGTGNGNTVPYTTYRVFANGDGSTLGVDGLCSSLNAAATTTSMVVCTGAARPDVIGHEASHLMSHYFARMRVEFGYSLVPARPMNRSPIFSAKHLSDTCLEVMTGKAYFATWPIRQVCCKRAL